MNAIRTHCSAPSLHGLQVYALGIKLLDGPAEVQHFPIEDILPSMEWRPQVAIAAACIVDPYVLLHFSDGSAVLLSGSEDEGERAESSTCPTSGSCCVSLMVMQCSCVRPLLQPALAAALLRQQYWCPQPAVRTKVGKLSHPTCPTP